MAATRKRPPAVPAPEPAPVLVHCDACAGTGQVAVTVRVGRKRRNAGQQEGICLGCFGTGSYLAPF